MNVGAQAVGNVGLCYLSRSSTTKTRSMARLDTVAFVVTDAWKPLVSEDITEEEETVLDCRASPVGSPHARTCPTSGLPSPPCFEDGHTIKCDGGSKIKEDGDWGERFMWRAGKYLSVS